VSGFYPESVRHDRWSWRLPYRSLYNPVKPTVKVDGWYNNKRSRV
jgi:hypothetical protein